MKKTMLFVLALVFAAMLPQDAQARPRKTIRRAMEINVNIADQAVDTYCSRYDCSNMDRGHWGSYESGYDYGYDRYRRNRSSWGSYNFGYDYGYDRHRGPSWGRFGQQVGHRVLDEIGESQDNKRAQEFMLLDRCTQGSQEACDILAGINPKKYGHMMSRPAQEGSYNQEPAAERTERRSARRLTVRVTNKARYTALVFDETGQELKEIPGNNWSAFPEFSNGSWAALDVQGVWCEADLSRNGNNVDILPRRTCTKVEIQ